MRKFRFPKDPLDLGRPMYDKGGITISPGITVLVGCNGSGKTTLLRTLQDDLRAKNVPVMFFDTLNTARDIVSGAMFKNDIELAASAMVSSEGERMCIGIGSFASDAKHFISTGRKRLSALEAAFMDDEPEAVTSKERWILVDSADSGLSIDVLLDVKNFFGMMVEYGQRIGVDLYVVVSTNQYEFAADSKCIDVQAMKPVSIKTYSKYRSVIMKSRAKKDTRDGIAN